MLGKSKTALLGIQHVLAMYAGAVVVPLLIGAAMGFNQEQMTYLVSIDIFMCGIATLLQLFVNKYFGIGLPVVLGCAIQTVSPLIIIGSTYGVGAMYGSIIASGIFVVLIAGVFSKIRILFPPLVTGTVITVIGLTLIPVALEKIGGGLRSMQGFGSVNYLLVGLFTIAIIVMLQGFARGFIRSIAILIGLLAGTGLGACMGMVNLSPIATSPYVHLPQFFYFGKPEFVPAAVFTMILISIVSMVESTGVYFALADIVQRDIKAEDLKKGYRAEGLAYVLGGLFNTFPYTGFSQNVGLVKLAGIKNNAPIYCSAAFLIGLGLLPKIGAMATIIPEPALGGAMLVMFGSVALAGICMLQREDLNDPANQLVVSISLALGLGVTIVPEIFQVLPKTVQIFTGNGIVVSSLTAIVLNVIIQYQKKSKKVLTNETDNSVLHQS